LTVMSNRICRVGGSGRNKGVTLLELIVALFILGLAILPLITSFGQSYALSTKQIEQETALKIAEAAGSKLMAVRFEDLNKPPVAIDIPFDVETADGISSGKIALSGSPANGAGSLDIGRMNYKIGVAVTRDFEGDNTNPKALSFQYYKDPVSAGVGPLPSYVATYACSDDFLRIDIVVRYGNPPQSISLTTYRGDLKR